MYYQSSDREGIQGPVYWHIRTTLSKTQVWTRETTIVLNSITVCTCVSVLTLGIIKSYAVPNLVPNFVW